MTTTPSRAVIRAAGAAAVLAAAALSAPAPAHAAPPPGPVLVCQSGICLLNPSGIDTDGDGFSDADETAAGTDPHDPTSHPQILQILHGYLDLGMRPDGFALREVIVLPTTAPDGTALASDLFAFGPQRTDALTRLGLTNPMLAGLSTDNGLRATVDLGRPNTAGGPPVMVGGVDISLISTIFRLDDAPKKPVTTHHDDGGVSTYAPGKGTDFGFAHVGATKTGADGTTTTTITTSSSFTGTRGSIFSLETVTHATKPDGTTTTTVAHHTYKDSKGKVTETTTSIFTQQVNPDGSKVNTFTETVTDKDGNTTTTVTTSTTDTEGKVTNKTSCTGANCPTRDTGEIDSAPVFAPGSTINATPELTRRIEALAASHTNDGDTGVEIGPDDEPEPPQYSPQNPGVIFVDTSNDAVWWTPELTLPDPDKVAGNITFVRGFEPITSHCLPTDKLPCPS